MPDQVLEDITEKIEEAREEIASGEKEAAQSTLDELRAKVAELEAMVLEHRGRIDGMDGRFAELEPLPRIAKNLREIEEAEQSPERTHWRYRRIGG